MLNTITVMGRLTKDPELRRTSTGKAVTSFTLAVERDYGQKGEKKETDFLDCLAWGTTAEFVNKYFTKGRMAVASGRLQVRPWTDKEGNKRRAFEIVASSVYFADSGNKSTGAGAAPEPGPVYDAPDPASPFAVLEDDDSDLPF